MATEIRVPTLGESVSEATVGKWFKKVGDQVAADEPLVELETDKVTLEVPAPTAGVIEGIDADDGAVVGVGAILGRINAGAAAAPTAAPAAAAPEPAKEVPSPAAASPATAVPPSPAVRKIAEEKNLSIASIEGTGKDGRVTKGDALAAIERGVAAMLAPAETSAPAETPVETRAPATPEGGDCARPSPVASRTPRTPLPC